MQISQKSLRCALSPMRKFHPYAVAAKAKGIKIYHLNIGQPDIETPQAFFDAVRGFSKSVLEYAPSNGIPVAIDAVVNYYKSLGINLTQNDVFVTTGGSEALQIVLTAILDEGSEIIVPEPFYPNYSTFVNGAGGRIVPLPTSVQQGYRYADRERIEKLITDKTRAIMFTNPGNPTGCVLTREEMRLLADIAKQHDLFIIGDEVYREFVYGGEQLASIGEFDDIQQNAIIIDSISKRFSACGARIGCVITRNAQLQEQITKFCQARLSVATLDQLGSAALYQLGSGYFDATREEYRQRRDVCYAKLCEIEGVVCSQPQGAFYIMAQLPVDDADKFQSWLLTDFSHNGETVMFAPGEGFYATRGKGKQEVRIAYVLCQKDLERAMELLAIGIKQYNQRNV